MFLYKLNGFLKNLCIIDCPICTVSRVIIKKSIHTQKFPSFDERIIKYLRADPRFSATVVTKKDNQRLEKKVRESFDCFFDRTSRKSLEKTLKKTFPVSYLSKLPLYILEVGQEQCYDKNQVGILSLCDFHCSKLVGMELESKFLSLRLLDTWMQVLDHYYLLSTLQCYPTLIQHSARELTSNSFLQNRMPEIIHLIFVASLGKKNVFESHEVVGQIYNFCIENPDRTYKTWTDFELGVMCSSLFRSRIRIESPELLRTLSSRLSVILENYLCSDGSHVAALDVSVVISLIKVLRQANFVEDSVLSGVSKLIMDKDKGEDILRSVTVLSHLVSGFSSSATKRQMTLDASLARVLNRTELLVNTTLRFEEETAAAAAAPLHPGQRTSSSSMAMMTMKNVAAEVHPSVKSRLKDISRWLSAAASLGYHQIRLEAYEADFSRRFSTGEFCEEAAVGVDALLSLAIMNHYPDSIVTKVLHSLHFRNTLKVCHRRQKVRFALFLTLVKIERNDLLRQLSPDDMSQLEDIAAAGSRSSRFEMEWTSKPFEDMIESHKMSRHWKLLNQCIDSLNKVFSYEEESFDNTRNKRKPVKQGAKQRTNNKIVLSSNLVDDTTNINEYDVGGGNGARIYRGYAVPYLFIPGIKIQFLTSGKIVYLEVIDTESYSVGHLRLKLRILSRQLGHTVLYVTPEEMEQCPDLGKFFKVNISRALFPS